MSDSQWLLICEIGSIIEIGLIYSLVIELARAVCGYFLIGLSNLLRLATILAVTALSLLSKLLKVMARFVNFEFSIKFS